MWVPILVGRVLSPPILIHPALPCYEMLGNAHHLILAVLIVINVNTALKNLYHVLDWKPMQGIFCCLFLFLLLFLYLLLFVLLKETLPKRYRGALCGRLNQVGLHFPWRILQRQESTILF